MLIELYTDISDVTLPILSRDKAIEILNGKGYIVGPNAVLDIIDPYIVSLNILFTDKVEVSKVYIDKEGKYCCELSSIKDLEYTKNLNASRNRLKRNSLLLESDWIENSPSITDGTKEQYRAYRQYLRDIFNYQDVTQFIDFPSAPSIIPLVTKSTRLSQANITKLQNYTPAASIEESWFMFLSEWAKTNYNSERKLINNLLAAYTNLSVKEILS